jgi:hypothetical protein
LGTFTSCILQSQSLTIYFAPPEFYQLKLEK